jgi:hypothetical protein
MSWPIRKMTFGHLGLGAPMDILGASLWMDMGIPIDRKRALQMETNWMHQRSWEALSRHEGRLHNKTLFVDMWCMVDKLAIGLMTMGP